MKTPKVDFKDNIIVHFFRTYVVLFFFAGGCALIWISQSGWLGSLIALASLDSARTIIKSIGASLIGSGVFTTIIKSSQYTEVFSNIIGEIIWSNKYIEKREDKKEIWSRISRLIYKEKFPLISDEIESIITSEYFPTTHQFYIEDYDFIVNIENENEHFWKQIETLNVLLKPTNINTPIIYNLVSSIDLPNDENIDDKTAYVIKSVSVNGIDYPLEKNPEPIKERNYFKYQVLLKLEKQQQYKITVVREKIICKKTNPDKKIFVICIVKNMKITVISEDGMNIGFHQMGTIKLFEELPTQVNGNIRICGWEYKGLILPHQGCILIFK